MKSNKEQGTAEPRDLLEELLKQAEKQQKKNMERLKKETETLQMNVFLLTKDSTK